MKSSLWAFNQLYEKQQNLFTQELFLIHNIILLIYIPNGITVLKKKEQVYCSYLSGLLVNTDIFQVPVREDRRPSEGQPPPGSY